MKYTLGFEGHHPIGDFYTETIEEAKTECLNDMNLVGYLQYLRRKFPNQTFNKETLKEVQNEIN